MARFTGVAVVLVWSAVLVDQQVTNLRKKIEPEPDRPRYLVALRGPRLPIRW